MCKPLAAGYDSQAAYNKVVPLLSTVLDVKRFDE